MSGQTVVWSVCAMCAAVGAVTVYLSSTIYVYNVIDRIKGDTMADNADDQDFDETLYEHDGGDLTADNDNTGESGANEPPDDGDDVFYDYDGEEEDVWMMF